MKILKIIGGIIALSLIVALVLTITVDSSYAKYMIPPVILLVMLYMFSPQVEWWWAQKHPPKTDPNAVKFLNEHFEFFKQLNGPNKDKFLKRLGYFLMSKEFIPKVGKNVPSPLKMIIAAEGVRMTFGMEDYLVDSHERIVIYPHPFPSPVHRKMHHSETFHDDGVLIFASSPVIHQYRGEGNIFNITLYEWISALKHGKNLVFPDFEVEDWHVFGLAFGTPKALVAASIGLPNFDMGIVGAVLYLMQKPLFMDMYPRQGARFAAIFGQ